MVGPREYIARLKRERLYRSGHVSCEPELEELEHEEREKDRVTDYRLALHAERQAILAKLRHARTLPPDQRVRTSPLLDYEHLPTGAAHVRELEQSIRDIDAELERIGEA